MNKYVNINRRRFLQRALMATAGGATLAATQGKLQLMKSALAASTCSASDEKSLVCVFLLGGNDSFNMFMPYEQTAYDQYADARGDLAVPRNEILSVNNGDSGFCQELAGVRDLYNEGSVAVVQNMGVLIQPLTRAEYLDAVASRDLSKVPEGLFAHNHAQKLWQTSAGTVAGSSTGWGGQVAEALAGCNTSENPYSFSVAGNNIWQTGRTTLPMVLHPSRSIDLMEGYEAELDNDDWSDSRATLMNQFLQQAKTDNQFLAQQAGYTVERAKLSSKRLGNILDNTPVINTTYDPDNKLAVQLRRVAELVHARNTLGLKRQIFFVAVGGWDTHTGQKSRHSGLLQMLNDGLYSFYRTLQELGLENTVTTFTASDFGRTLTSNGNGTDHGWGGHNLVIGGSVKGGVYGTMPEFEIGGVDDGGNKGRIIPTISVNQYSATLARWIGVSETDIENIFPDLTNFTKGNLEFFSI
ncbi:MAG TPA: hypothetical protein DCZ12_02490 [Gammaproteobacteria bacterium]|nr:hypothetical protein [Gammaproteobacteria bacterium]